MKLVFSLCQIHGWMASFEEEDSEKLLCSSHWHFSVHVYQCTSIAGGGGILYCICYGSWYAKLISSWSQCCPCLWVLVLLSEWPYVDEHNITSAFSLILCVSVAITRSNHYPLCERRSIWWLRISPDCQWPQTVEALLSTAVLLVHCFLIIIIWGWWLFLNYHPLSLSLLTSYCHEMISCNVQYMLL